MRRTSRPTHNAIEGGDRILHKLEPYRISKRCKEHRGFCFIGSFEECSAEHTRTKAIDENFKGKRDRFFRCSCLFKISRIKLHSAIAVLEELAHTTDRGESR